MFKLRYWLTFLDIYVNLAVKTKRYLDVCETGIEVADAHVKLLRFYNVLSMHKDFEKVDKADFYELSEQFRNNQKQAKEQDTKLLEESFRSLEPPSKKQASGSSSSPL